MAPVRHLNRRHFEPLTILGLTLCSRRTGGSLRRRNVELWQQNTSTRKLTEEMLDGVFFRARELLGWQATTSANCSRRLTDA
jgi:hypothetical protein